MNPTGATINPFQHGGIYHYDAHPRSGVGYEAARVSRCALGGASGVAARGARTGGESCTDRLPDNRRP